MNVRSFEKLAAAGVREKRLPVAHFLAANRDLAAAVLEIHTTLQCPQEIRGGPATSRILQ